MNLLRPLPLLAALAIAGFGCNGTGGIPTAGRTTTPLTSCPVNYVLVPGNAVLGTSDFCIAKYDAKNVGGLPASVAADAPWSSVTRDQAKAACAALGENFALPDNAHWMTIARNIESVAWNWGGDLSLHQYGPSRGITNNPSSATAGFPASTDDNEACYLSNTPSGGPVATCDLTHYDVARRVHQLSNGDYLWDFSGNVSEWISDDFTTNYGVNAWTLNLVPGVVKNLFGPAGIYPAGSVAPTGNIYMYNFGYTNTSRAAPAVVARGGAWDYGRYAGIYTTYFSPSTTAGTRNGFRCMFQP